MLELYRTLVANQCIAAINSIMARHFDYQSVAVIMMVMSDVYDCHIV